LFLFFRFHNTKLREFCVRIFSTISPLHLKEDLFTAPLSPKFGDFPLLLLIEDNRDVVIYIQTLLQNSYDIRVAYDGAEGIEKAQEIIPDIIISDVMMPQKNGYEVCQTLKNDTRTSHIPIILLTAKASTPDRIKGLQQGADAYLTKPFNKEELQVRLQKLVALRQQLQEKYGQMPMLQAPKTTTSNLEDVFLQKLCAVVEKRINDTDLGVKDLCFAAKLSPVQVNRKLKALTDKTPSLFIRLIRLQKGKEMLQSSDLTIAEVAYSVGFTDPNYFSRAFSEEFGHPPSERRK
jgi:DNA-binding response OmpR family regulator